MATKSNNVNNGKGPKAQTGKKVYNAVRPQLAASGVTLQQALTTKKQLSATQVPAGYISVAQLHKVCKANYVPITRMVKAIGGDRAMLPPAHAICTVVYVNGTRYVNSFLATKTGLQCILTGNWAPANKALAQQAQAKAKKSNTGAPAAPAAPAPTA